MLSFTKFKFEWLGHFIYTNVTYLNYGTVLSHISLLKFTVHVRVDSSVQCTLYMLIVLTMPHYTALQHTMG